MNTNRLAVALTIINLVLLINNMTEPGVHLLAKQDDTSLTLTDQSGAEQVIKP
jgi:hypothetical protein